MNYRPRRSPRQQAKLANQELALALTAAIMFLAFLFEIWRP
jgi:hypothetical protein